MTAVQVRQIAFLLFWTAFCFGLSLSPALISIGQAGIAALGILSLKSIRLNRDEKWLSAIFVIFYALGAVSYLYSDNSSEAVRKLILKLPVLLFPLLIYSFKTYRHLSVWVLMIFAYAMFLPASVSVYNYFSNKVLFDLLILESKPLPIEFGYGIYHIQFSILLAISVLLCLDYCIKNKGIRDWKWYTLLSMGVLNLLFIHILSARTGLLSLYVGAALYAFLSLKTKGGKYMLYVFFGGLALFVVMLLGSSSLKNRLENSIEDFKVVWNNKDPNDYSFALRVQAWKNAIDLISRHPMGTGIGDAEKDLYDNFEKTNPNIQKDNRKNPHFQMLETGAQSGVLSILAYLVLIVSGLSLFRKNHLLKGIVLLLFVASCFESILESQASVAAFALFIAIGIAFHEERKQDNRIV